MNKVWPDNLEQRREWLSKRRSEWEATRAKHQAEADAKSRLKQRLAQKRQSQQARRQHAQEPQEPRDAEDDSDPGLKSETTAELDLKPGLGHLRWETALLTKPRCPHTNSHRQLLAQWDGGLLREGGECVRTDCLVHL